MQEAEITDLKHTLHLLVSAIHEIQVFRSQRRN